MQLERKRAALEGEGIRLAAISNDTAEALGHFAERAGIGFPLLSDADSEIIRSYGVLNETVPRDHQFYGIPHPVEFLLGPDRMVRAKYFEDDYKDRFTAGRVLVRQFGSETGSARKTFQTAHLKAVTWASDSMVRGGNRFALAVDVELKPGMHVYAPGVQGYIAIDWSMEDGGGLTHFEAEYPPSRTLHLPAIDETVPVFEGSFRLIRDVLLGQPGELGELLAGEQLTIRGNLRYQACDDRMCYLPTTVPLEWTVAFEQHDRNRVPEPLRR